MIGCSFELNDKLVSSFKMGAPSFAAFSGLDNHVNRTISQCIPNQGPIPKGDYYIFNRQSGGLFGPLMDLFNDKDEWFALYSIDNKIDDEAYCEQVKRGQFRLHPRGRLGACPRIEVVAKKWEFEFIFSAI